MRVHPVRDHACPGLALCKRGYADDTTAPLPWFPLESTWSEKHLLSPFLSHTFISPAV